VTITIASPGVVAWTAHALALATPVYFCTTSALPTGLTACSTVSQAGLNILTQNPTLYYVIPVDADHFRVATSAANAIAGTAVNTSGSQSGTQTAFANAFACAGCIGEYVFKLASITNANVGNGSDNTYNSITLTPGVWKVGGSTGVIATGGTTPTFITNHSSYGMGISSICTTPYCGTTNWHVSTNNSNGNAFPFDDTIVQVYSTGSMNFVCEPVWTGASTTATCFGDGHAVRMR
jgi:hypothetical protein